VSTPGEKHAAAAPHGLGRVWAHPIPLFFSPDLRNQPVLPYDKTRRKHPPFDGRKTEPFPPIGENRAPPRVAPPSPSVRKFLLSPPNGRRKFGLSSPSFKRSFLFFALGGFGWGMARDFRAIPPPLLRGREESYFSPFGGGCFTTPPGPPPPLIFFR